MTGGIFSDDFTTTPYWWADAPLLDAEPGPPPARIDAVVVGAGYAGLQAALQIARGGRSVVVFDARAAGWGCSTRNGGQISTSVKPGLAKLKARHGEAAARRIVEDGRRSLAWIGDFIREERIDCDFKVAGRFHAAHNPARFRMLAEECANQPPGLEVPLRVVPRSEQRDEIGTDAYHGGVVFEAHASLHPARYHAGLVARAEAAGVLISPMTPVTGFTRDGDGFEVVTSRGRIRARDVVLATNGYSGGLSPWHQRRVIPIGSYIIATEELPESLVDKIIPRDRVVSDTRKVVYYYRASPDRRRIIFGGRVSLGETDPRRSAPLLRDALVRLFPQLARVRISHSWMGFVAYTFDELAHVGSSDGLHYAMGYCGSGVGMASYLGMRTGQRVLGIAEGATGFDEPRFQTRPFYSGNPWFLAPAVRYYRWRDRIGA